MSNNTAIETAVQVGRRLDLARRLKNLADLETDAQEALLSGVDVHLRSYGSQEMMNDLHTLAKSEGAAITLTRASQVLTHQDYTQGRFVEWLIETANADPDDTWSGRGNDLKRMQAEGRRQAIARIYQLAVRNDVLEGG